MQKFILTIADAITVGYSTGATLDIGTMTVTDTAGAQLFSSWERAFDAWMVRRAQLRDMYVRDGWQAKPDDGDAEDVLRLILDRGGVIRQRLFRPQISRVTISLAVS